MTPNFKMGDGERHQTIPAKGSVAGADGDTIAAIATAAGSGGIGIIRISGPKAGAIAQRLFRPGSARPKEKPPQSQPFKPYRLNYGHLVGPCSGQPLDEVLLAFMPGPRSYTREDIIEIQCHGGQIVLQKILDMVRTLGARLAEPGEFTRRAFLNGRIDLSQAEAVADLINARSEMALKLAARQLSGELGSRINGIVDAVTDMLAEIEADLEFGEQGSVGVSAAAIDDRALQERVIEPIQGLLRGYGFGRILRDGLKLAIVGRPNVGKSSLLNRIIDREKAIVTPFPGTTRDPVEASATIEGVGIRLIDTAGLRESQDPIERMGIEKTREALRSADLVLFVIEAQTTPGAEDQRILAEIKGREFLLVVNKCDLVTGAEMIRLPEAYRVNPAIFVSAKTGDGLDRLKKGIGALWGQGAREEMGETLVSDLRHKLALEGALFDARNAARGLKDNRAATDMVAMDLKHALVQLQGITGQAAGGDVLDAIFRKFCIGK